MAFNKSGDKGFQRTPQPSAPIDTYFSTDSQDGSYQFLKVSTYGDKISINFYKGRKGDPNKSTQYISFDYETVCAILNYVIDPLVRQRAIKFQNGEEYPVGVWLNYALTFVDGETKQLRTVGNFVVKSEICPSTQRNTVYICYTNGADEWKVALGASNLQSHLTIENPQTEGLDPTDSRFQQFGYMLRSIVNNWVMIQMVNHQTGLMMNNFNAIKSKLGIESKRYSGKDNGNYTDSNYRSSAPDAADSSDSGDAGEFGGDMPF